MYKALYRSYRPEVFDDVLGQEHILRILKNQLSANQVSHAYLFCGTRGTGKTTIARLLAKAVNCTAEGGRPCGLCDSCKAIAEGNFMDLIEIDAASNNGVDNIRELRESVNYPPVAGKKKVYIMDEVHMLSSGAFNALLKTLEEPPENVMFILCTTEPEKLPATILSRCVRMDFCRVSERELLQRIKLICEEKGIAIDPSGAALIASAADGSVRDGLSILEQCISGRAGVVERDDVLDALGTVGEEAYLALTDCVTTRQVAEGLVQIDHMLGQGKDARQIIRGWMGHFRNLLLVKFLEQPQNVLSMSIENIDRVRSQSQRMEPGFITGAIKELSRTIFESNRSSQPRVLLEMAFVKLAARDGFDDTVGRFNSVTPQAVNQGHSSAIAPAPSTAVPMPVTSTPGAETVSLAEPTPMPPTSGTETVSQVAPTPAVMDEFGMPMQSEKVDGNLVTAGEPFDEPGSAILHQDKNQEAADGGRHQPSGERPAMKASATLGVDDREEPATLGVEDREEPAGGNADDRGKPATRADDRDEPTTLAEDKDEPATLADDMDEPGLFDPPMEEEEDPLPGQESMSQREPQAVTEIPVNVRPAMPQSEPVPGSLGYDIGTLWEIFLDRGEEKIGTRFFFVRDRAKPLGIEGETFKVAARDAAATYMKEEQKRLSVMLSEIAGSPLTIRIVEEDDALATPPAAPAQAMRKEPAGASLAGVEDLEATVAALAQDETRAPSENSDGQEDAEEMRQRASDLLGIDVKLQ